MEDKTVQFRVQVGDKIWRPVEFEHDKSVTLSEAVQLNQYRKIVRPYEAAELTDRGTYIMRASHAQFHVNSDALWAFAPNVRSGDRLVPRVGLVVFLKEQLPENWAWLIVTSLTRKGNALFAQPVSGDYLEEELLNSYKAPNERKEA